MEALLNRIAASDDADVSLLSNLIDQLRPAQSDNLEQAGNNLLALCYRLEQAPTLRCGLRNYLLRIIAARKQSHLYTDTGIFPGTDFLAEAKQRLAWKVLPPAINDAYLKDVFGLLFPRRNDWEWIGGLDDSAWVRLLQALHYDELTDTAILQRPVLEVLEALTTLSHRMTGLGLENELTRIHPAIEQHGSPFLGLNDEIGTYVREYRDCLTGQCRERSDEKQALVLVAQCRDTLQKVRRHASSTGVSISLTQLVVRISQMLSRIEHLLRLLEARGEDRHLVIVQLFKELVTADNRKYSLRDLFSTHTELLALLVTENAGNTGEHYVTTTRREYINMLRSGMGAGLIVGFMAMLKMLAGKLSLAPLAAAFLYSMNYSLGFMLVHVMHFTIATKQPAMTASRIAASISEAQKGSKQDLEGLADLCVNVFRTQFIAIIGNVVIALPTAYVIAWTWMMVTGKQLANADKVANIIHDLSPVDSLAVFHAAIAGVCLFLAGLISGYYDNKCLYNRIPERLQQRAFLQRLLGQERLNRLSHYVGKNMGALAGNFYFGLMLGSMGTIGFILGLPLDIRHITFSSAYFSFALAGSEHQLPLHTIAISLAGIAAIGMTNLLVSFSLALMVALKSRRVRYRQWWPLAVMIGKRFLKNPGRFFLPPRSTEDDTNTAGNTH